MKPRYLLSSLAILGSVALAAPAFAQQTPADQPNATAGQNSVSTQTAMPGNYRNANNMAAGDTAMSQPAPRHFRASEAGQRYGVDVARGGGFYTRADVAVEPPGRMSHPGVGSPRAPSGVASGSLAHVDAVENAMTARLNDRQARRAEAALHAYGQQASLPSDSE